jgi:hypothetical protein
MVRDERIAGARSPWWLNFVWWHLIFESVHILHTTVLAQRILKWFLELWKICAHLILVMSGIVVMWFFTSFTRKMKMDEVVITFFQVIAHGRKELVVSVF